MRLHAEKGAEKIPAFARDLLNSDNAGHRLTFQLFDPRKRFFRKRLPPEIARARPSITFFDRGGYRRIYLCPAPRPSLPPRTDRP